MTDREALYKIYDHLLGSDYYIVDPVSNDQGNDIMVEEILNRYKARNKHDNKVLRYRKKHKRCKYCKYLRYVSSPTGDCSYFECDATGNIIHFIDMPRTFCSCYTVDIKEIK